MYVVVVEIDKAGCDYRQRRHFVRHECISAALDCLCLEANLLGKWVGYPEVAEHEIAQRGTEHDVAWLNVPVNDPKKMHDSHAVFQSFFCCIFVRNGITVAPRQAPLHTELYTVTIADDVEPERIDYLRPNFEKRADLCDAEFLKHSFQVLEVGMNGPFLSFLGEFDFPLKVKPLAHELTIRPDTQDYFTEGP